MTSIYDMFKTNANLEQDGIWINYGTAGKFLVARSGGSNTMFAKVLEAKMRPYRRQLDNETMDAQVAQDILMETFVETVLKGWEGVKDEKGKEIKFSKEAALKLFRDLPELFNDLRLQSTKLANYLASDLEDDVGN